MAHTYYKHSRTLHRCTRAFSLVELSIVLVILGLLVGGVLAGQSLIRAAQLRAIVTEYQRFTTARSAFRDKYFALPGDMPNATSFWGYAGIASCTNNTGAAVNATTGVCDGDGDGTLRHATAASKPSEAFQGWRELALAGIIEGSYTGIGGTGYNGGFNAYGGGGAGYTPGTNCPPSKIGSACWGLTYFDNSTTMTAIVFTNNYLNYLTVGGTADFFADDAILKPEEAWNIDSKIDDGKPNSGNVHAWPAASCATTTQYTLTTTSIACPLFFKQ